MPAYSLHSPTLLDEMAPVVMAQFGRRSAVKEVRSGQIEPDEAISATYIALSRRRPGGCIDGDTPRHYIARTAMGETRKLISKESKLARRRVDFPCEPLSREQEPIQAIIREEDSERLQSLWTQLAPPEADLLRMYYGIDRPELRPAEIAELLNAKTPAIRKRLRKTLRRCRSLLNWEV